MKPSPKVLALQLLVLLLRQMAVLLVALMSVVPVDAIGDKGLGAARSVRHHQASFQPCSLGVRADIAYLRYLVVHSRAAVFLSFELLNLTREPAPLAVFVGLMIASVSKLFGCAGNHENQ